MDFSIAYEEESIDGNRSCVGFLFEEQYVIKHFPNEIKKKLTDYHGTLNLIKSFETISNTEFDKSVLEEIFRLKLDRIDPWRIGEAFGEFFLQEHFNVRFWYNHLRDLRNPNASDAGSDLVGFTDVDGETLFVFGEIKTSGDKNSPPQVVYGRSGLKKQIDDLVTNKRTINNLIRYLAFKVLELQKNDPFYLDFHRALAIYLKNQKRIHLFGLLVRDTACNCNDLKKRYLESKYTAYKDLLIKFLGLYIPIALEKWQSIVNGGGTSNG